MMQNDKVNRKALDLPAARERLANASGRHYWRSLEEIAETDEFREMVDREFPEGTTEWFDPVSRRNFLKLMGASLALAGVGACARQPDEAIVPYVKAPEQFVPGKPSYFATAMPLRGYGIGLLAESHLGRPTKLEGNTDHPASMGATDAIAQASILGLYDPDRSQSVTFRGRGSSWEALRAVLATEVGAWKAAQGSGLRILSETVGSPTLALQMRQLQAAYPKAVWHQYEPAARDNVREGARQAFGAYVDTHYDFTKAQVVLALDADFLLTMPGSVRHAHDFSSMRRPATGATTMNRLYAIESSPTVTGASADHRAALPPSGVEQAAWQIAAALGVPGATARGSSPAVDELAKKWIPAVAADLKAHAGTSIVIAGDEQPPAMHALAHAMNAMLGNVGATVVYSDPVEADPINQTASLAELAAAMEGGAVDVLVILGANPVHTAPADLKFTERMKKVRLRVHFGQYNDETAEYCHWHVPEAHYLESWSDTRAVDGTAAIIQPLIAPLWNGRSVHEVVAALYSSETTSAYDLVRGFWQTAHSVTAPPAAAAPAATDSSAAPAPAPAAVSSAALSGPDFEKMWHEALFRGTIAGTAASSRTVTLRPDWSSAAATRSAPTGAAIELIFRLDPMLFDGRFANLAWLQEVPKPLTKLVWDNALLLSPATAKSLGLETKDVVEITAHERTVTAPVWVMPGHADGCGTLQLGHGRKRVGRVGNDVGVNAYTIRTSDAPWHVAEASVKKTGDTYSLVTTQTQQSMEGREVLRYSTLAEYVADHKVLEEKYGEVEPAISLYPPRLSPNADAWGMAIDLSACIACNACVIACQSENNIPVVGKDQVDRGRAMHWIRIDRYYEGNPNTPEPHFQPVTCMQCEMAPCETVCPVGATVHSEEGLNDMVYNRCIGTRYCSNNCPYKVRRFNYLRFNDDTTPSLKMMRNPDVTVRSRGVMEKCTYCVQRINSARIESKKLGATEQEQRKIQDGEIVTACEQVCPTGAITFGNIRDEKSRVAKLKASPLNYRMLEDLDTQPRTSYLTKLRNPNPELEKVA